MKDDMNEETRSGEMVGAIRINVRGVKRPPVAPEGRANLDAQMDGLLSEWDASPPHGAGSEYAALCTMRRLALEVGQRIGRAALLAELAGTAGEEIRNELRLYAEAMSDKDSLCGARHREAGLLAAFAALAKEREEARANAMRAAIAAGEERLRANRLEAALDASRAAALEEAAVYFETNGVHWAVKDLRDQIAARIRALKSRALVPGPGATDGRGRE